MCRVSSGVATVGVGWVGPDPPIMFRHLLRLEQIRWKLFCNRGYAVYVYCNFLLLTSKKKIVQNPHMFGLATTLRVSGKFERIFSMSVVLRIRFFLCKQHKIRFTCLALQPGVSWDTNTCVTVHTIGTISAVLTRIADAFIDIYARTKL